jgi:anti-sigma-K factor RskA
VTDRTRIEELAAMVAAGAATDEERAELDHIVAADPSAAAELAELEEAAAALALALEPVEPPANALDQIRAKVSTRKATIAGPPPAPVQGDPAPKASTTPEYAAKDAGAEVIDLASRRKQRGLVAVAFVAIAAAAALLLLWQRDRSRLEEDLATKNDEIRRVVEDAQKEINELGRRLEAAGREAKTLRARLAPLAGTDLSLTRLANEKEGGVAHVIADRSGRRWLVIAAELPEISDDQDYQLWFVPQGGAPISAGLLRAGPDGVLAATPELPAGLDTSKPVSPAISLEPRGGSPQPTDVKMIGEPI